MKLRTLSAPDLHEALRAQEELAADGFDFLLGYDPDAGWDRFLEDVEGIRQGRHLPEGYVPATFLVAEDGGELVGRVSIRHHLNPHLRSVGGHIGYAVRPRFRRRGYARQILELALVEAARLGIGQVMLTCDAGNLASKATIERCGGIQETSRPGDPVAEGTLRYWIDIPAQR